MATHRITLASNTNRNIKTILLLPSTTPDLVAFIFSAAKSKLRLKKPTKLYVLPTGAELTSHADILSVATTSIYQPTILVSLGEPYVGSVAPPAPVLSSVVHSLVDAAFLDPLSLRQLHTCAALPGMLRVVGQPDLHPGTKFPIGAAFVSAGWLHPPLIGGDIGCGMSWYRVSLSAASLATRAAVQRLAETIRGVEGPWEDQPARETWLGGAEHAVGDPRFDAMLGTIGAGNHFAELQIIEESSADAVAAGDVVLLVHSGSRGFGQDVLARFYDPASGDHPESIPAGTPQAAAYLAAHDKAVHWAQANRDLIALRFLQRLEPHNPDWTADAPDRALVQGRKFVDITHNAVEASPWSGEPEPVYIHRKGAAPCTPSMALLPLPGSRGTPTLLLAPTGTGEHNGFSAAHGAGRAMSRAKAAVALRGKWEDANTPKTGTARERYGEDFHAGGSGGGGSGAKKRDEEEAAGWTICDEKELAWEEAPEAYKDVELVARDLETAGVCRVVGRARPKLTYKVRFEQGWKEAPGEGRKRDGREKEREREKGRWRGEGEGEFGEEV
ncbi:tRNA-splicing ligase RtcB-domain-containing protein [Geopyxis carbonaria]|nr:tRNA-splicing ligase RtcB-domain-containing protein [Geopyxis carbonaria]